MIKRRELLKLFFGVALLPISSCTNEEVIIETILKSIKTEKLIGILILNKLKIGIKKSKNRDFNELKESLIKYSNKNDKSLTEKIELKIQNDFIENRIVKIKKIAFSNYETELYFLLVKQGIKIA